jgi:hypothetical protein
MGEEPATGNEVLRGVKLEEKRLARRKQLKETAAAGLPEIYLIKRRAIPEEPKPFIVGDGNVRLHAPPLSRPVIPIGQNSSVRKTKKHRGAIFAHPVSSCCRELLLPFPPLFDDRRPMTAIR